ncbi:MAG: diacylglycerol kinase family protein [Muribaculaceae bacterium]|nr:diacylglycerol kinase family protein [Muribaculaceae bacterium]
MGSWKSYLHRRRKAFGYAFAGIGRLIKGEAHARLHVVSAILAIAFGLWLGIDRWEWVAVIICIGGVFMAEAFNSAVERLADRVTSDFDPLIGEAKDLAAGAVLLFSIATLIVAAIIYIPRLITLFIS